MLPISNPKQAARLSLSRARPEGEGRGTQSVASSEGDQGSHSDDKSPLRPVGMERLKALREAIENGSYPTEADVLGGLERLLKVDEGDETD